jgi:protein dpy-30
MSDIAYYDDMEQGLEAELAATTFAAKVPTHALPMKSYIEATVMPVLLHGLEALVKERPLDPVEYLACYLLSNNPQRDAVLPMPPEGPLQGAKVSVSQPPSVPGTVTQA